MRSRKETGSNIPNELLQLAVEPGLRDRTKQEMFRPMKDKKILKSMITHVMKDAAYKTQACQ